MGVSYTRIAISTYPIDLIFFSRAYLGTSEWARKTPILIKLVVFSFCGTKKNSNFLFFFPNKISKLHMTQNNTILKRELSFTQDSFPFLTPNFFTVYSPLLPKSENHGEGCILQNLRTWRRLYCDICVFFPKT